ncbi:MAG: ATP-binding cassette domain-containing protein [Chloroflexota bacterium]|nr:ATP-binding cassette domain-containing protein [Chloroflexota bacterium]
MNDWAIHASGISRSFGEVKAVNGVDLAIRKGEVYGFLGPNGAGKTTLVRMLITLLLPTAGQAWVLGRELVSEAKEIRLRIGAALQETALDPKQTGIEFLRLQGFLYGLTGRQVRRRVDELASLVDIGDAMGRFIGTYSGGMKRRLDLAAAMIHNPEVLFLDEPTTGLDPISRSRVWEEIRRVRQELGVTIFLTTQYLEEADQLADRVGIINQGVLAAEGTPEQLKRSLGSDVIIAVVEEDQEAARVAVDGLPAVEQVDVYGNEVVARVSNGAAHIGAVALALDRSNIVVREIRMRTPTLDDVFLSVTGERFEEVGAEEVSDGE